MEAQVTIDFYEATRQLMCYTCQYARPRPLLYPHKCPSVWIFKPSHRNVRADGTHRCRCRVRGNPANPFVVYWLEFCTNCRKYVLCDTQPFPAQTRSDAVLYLYKQKLL